MVNMCTRCVNDISSVVLNKNVNHKNLSFLLESIDVYGIKRNVFTNVVPNCYCR